VDWHAHKDNVFGSVGDDKMLMMYGRKFSFAQPCLTDEISVGTQGRPPNRLQKLKRTIEKSSPLHSVLLPSISSSQGVQTRFVEHRLLMSICSSHVEYRPLFFTTSGHRARNYMYSSRIQTKSFICPGLHITQLSSLLHLVIGELIFGICRKLASNKPRMIRRMVLLS